MRAVVLGAGRMGRAAAWDLARQPGVGAVKLVDHDGDALANSARELERLLTGTTGGGAARIETARGDLDDTASLPAMMEGSDVGTIERGLPLQRGADPRGDRGGRPPV